jgi:hypothetical protein
MARLIDLDPNIVAEVEAVTTAGQIQDAVGDRDYRGLRRPFYITCRKWAEEEGRYIILYCNPSDVEFRFPWRESEQEIKGGMVRHSWRNKGTYLKEPGLSITYQTGNVMPRIANGAVEMSPGLSNLYDFMELLDEDRVYNSRPNYVEIAFNSMTFPVLVIHGFFAPEDFTLPQSSEELHGFSFSIEFTARTFHPDITKASTLVQAFKGSPAFTVKSFRRDQAAETADAAESATSNAISTVFQF